MKVHNSLIVKWVRKFGNIVKDKLEETSNSIKQEVENGTFKKENIEVLEIDEIVTFVKKNSKILKQENGITFTYGLL